MIIVSLPTDEIRKIHLPQYEEIYAKVRNRVGKIIVKHKKSRDKNPQKVAIEILDTAYQIIRDKLLKYKEFYKKVLQSEELKTYLTTVLGEEALNTLRATAYLTNRLKNLWLTLRRELEYMPERGREINKSIKQVSRLLSYVKRKQKLLEYSLNIKKELSLLPGLPDLPRIIVVGPPNAGKSSLASRISKTKTKVADYPFTTKVIEPGILEIINKGINITVLDTPGLLLRSDKKRNIIEKRALAAIKLPNTISIFVIDPFSTIMNLEEQLELLNQVLNLNPNVIVVINKVDIDLAKSKLVKEEIERKGYKAIMVSALTGDGLEMLINALTQTTLSLLKSKNNLRSRTTSQV